MFWRFPCRRISKEILQCSCYLYRSESDALNGVRTGGTGFLVSMVSATGALAHIYVVTNRHVIEEGFWIFRLNTKQGQAEALPTERASWVTADHDDLAVLPIELTNAFSWTSISTDLFVSEEDFPITIPFTTTSAKRWYLSAD